MRKFQSIIITGGAGFIGSNLIRYIFEKTDYEGKIINLDKLTYAGNPYNLSDIESSFGGKRYFFEKADICDMSVVKSIMEKYSVDAVIHLAAESHVDRSISDPLFFVRTNLLGTANLLQCVKAYWKNDFKGKRFYHISPSETRI